MEAPNTDPTMMDRGRRAEIARPRGSGTWRLVRMSEVEMPRKRFSIVRAIVIITPENRERNKEKRKQK